MEVCLGKGGGGGGESLRMGLLCGRPGLVEAKPGWRAIGISALVYNCAVSQPRPSTSPLGTWAVAVPCEGAEHQRLKGKAGRGARLEDRSIGVGVPHAR